MKQVLRAREVASSFIVLLGVTTFLVHGYHFLEEDALSQVLTGVVPPALVSVALMVGAVFLYRSDLDDKYFIRVLVWTVGGMVGLAALGYALLLYQLAHGAEVLDLIFIEINWATTGGLAGFLIGYYNANMIQVRDRLAEEHDRLARREDDLERQNERQEKVVQVVSHDLRNPMNVVQGRLDLFRETGEMDHIETAQTSLDRMEDIIEDMLAMIREGRQVAEVERAEVDLASIADQSWSNVDTADASLEVESDCTLLADESRVQNLFENLFRNAVEHGGRDVLIRVGRLPGKEGFFVEDTGRGLPADQPVFEAGYSTSDSGTGLGLSIVQDIATAHGWEVTATEGADGGARFEFNSR